jgi:fluoride exporter
MIFVRELLAVIVGGMLGTGLRFAIDSLLPHDPTGFPVSTLIVNVVGSLVLAYLVARVWPVAKPWLRAGLGAGMLGSFTTFSALAVSLVQLGFGATAAVYLALTLVLGFAAAFVGLRLGSRRTAAIDEVNE